MSIEKEYKFDHSDFRGTDFETTTFQLKIDYDENERWYDWELSLDMPPGALNQIKSVEYILHPTYRDRIRTLKASQPQIADKFKLEFGGYDGFRMPINIYLNEMDSMGYNKEVNVLFTVETH